MKKVLAIFWMLLGLLISIFYYLFHWNNLYGELILKEVFLGISCFVFGVILFKKKVDKVYFQQYIFFSFIIYVLIRGILLFIQENLILLSAFIVLLDILFIILFLVTTKRLKKFGKTIGIISFLRIKWKKVVLIGLAVNLLIFLGGRYFFSSQKWYFYNKSIEILDPSN